MAGKVKLGGIIESSLITAFTIVAALIWKEAISNAISQFVPERQELFYEFLIAIFVTIIVIIAIIIIVKTGSETEIIIRKVKEKQQNAKKQKLLSKEKK